MRRRGSSVRERLRIPLLSLGQLISWGSMYYAFGLLIEPLSLHLSASRATLSGAFSLALLVTGLLAWPVGILIDRGHSRAILTAGSILGALGLGLHTAVNSVVQLYAVWSLLGVAMAMSLYEPAFAMLIRAYPQDYRRRIAILTLLGGLASTVFWPLVAWLLSRVGWQGTLGVLAGLQLAVALIHGVSTPADANPGARGAPTRPGAKSDSGSGPRSDPDSATPSVAGAQSSFTADDGGASPGVAGSSANTPRKGEHHQRVSPLPVRSPVFLLLVGFFASNLLVMAATHAHLPGLLQAQGLSLSTTLMVAAILGPTQLIGRLLMLAGGHRVDSSGHAKLTAWLPSLAMLVLAFIGWGLQTLGGTAATILGLAGASLYGSGNGILTIVKATAIADLIGAQRVATLNGIAAVPSALFRALGPWLVAWIWEATGEPAAAWVVLALTSALSAGLFRWAVAVSITKSSARSKT
jgi:MFS family permease